MACKYVKDFDFGPQKATKPAVKGYRAGGKVHDDAAKDKPMIKAAVHKHEKVMHPGEALTKLKCGGFVKKRK